jgi:hypothetical protein
MVPIIHHPAAFMVTSLCPPLVASLAASMGDIAVVTLGLPRPVVESVESPTLEEPTLEAQDASVSVMPSADDASQGTTSVEVDGADPQLGDGIGGLLQDLVR